MREPYALKGARTVPGRGEGGNTLSLFDGPHTRRANFLMMATLRLNVLLWIRLSRKVESYGKY